MGLTLTFLPRPICLPCTLEANMALRRHRDATCKDHGESWMLKACVELGAGRQGLGCSPQAGPPVGSG